MLVKKQVREQRKEHQIRLSQRVAHVEGLEDIHVNPHGKEKKKDSAGMSHWNTMQAAERCGRQ